MKLLPCSEAVVKYDEFGETKSFSTVPFSFAYTLNESVAFLSSLFAKKRQSPCSPNTASLEKPKVFRQIINLSFILVNIFLNVGIGIP